MEKIRAAFTVLRAFGSVSTGHSRSATRFAMVMSLDFNATGRVTAAQLQVRPLGGRGRESPELQGPQPPLSRAHASSWDPGMCLNGHRSPGRGQLLPTSFSAPISHPGANWSVCILEYHRDEIFMSKYIIQPLISWVLKVKLNRLSPAFRSSSCVTSTWPVCSHLQNRLPPPLPPANILFEQKIGLGY